MSFYSLWYKQTINGVAPSSSATSSQTDLTVAQVTVCSIKDKLVYNIEYKPTSLDEKPLSKRASGRRVRQSTTSSSSTTSSTSTTSSSSSNTFAAASIVAANFRNHGRNHSRIHSRQVSSESLSEVSMWDDWIVKYINEDNKKTIMAEDSPMEEWIFETM